MEAKIVMHKNSQAVRLPREVAFPEHVHSVEVLELGDSRLLTPVQNRWDSFFAGPSVSEDFMADREQPEAQEREAI